MPEQKTTIGTQNPLFPVRKITIEFTIRDRGTLQISAEACVFNKRICLDTRVDEWNDPFVIEGIIGGSGMGGVIHEGIFKALAKGIVDQLKAAPATT